MIPMEDPVISELVALLQAHGVCDVVLCPGSRNAPLVHALSHQLAGAPATRSSMSAAQASTHSAWLSPRIERSWSAVPLALPWQTFTQLSRRLTIRGCR